MAVVNKRATDQDSLNCKPSQSSRERQEKPNNQYPAKVAKKLIFVFCQTVTGRCGVGLTTRCPKANKQARLVERKVCFFSDASNLGVRTDICPKANSPHRTFIVWGWGTGGGLHAEQHIQCDSHRQTGHWWPDQCHPDCFRYR